MSKPGLFISFEGSEGSGKSTQLRLLVERLRSAGYAVTENQEPGGTSIGKQIRRILLDPANAELAPMAELLLMFASRAQAAAQVVQPALARGEIVISDRFTDSTLAYQGAARGLGFDVVRQAHRIAVGELLPDLTVCLTVDVAEGLERARRRNTKTTSGSSEDRLDEHDIAFHRCVLDGYRRIAELEPGRFHLVDGSGDQQAVAARIWALVEPRIASQPMSQ